ncbi:MAG: hypothetical protein LH702_04555 [Phormidesmis sp. CAN_BIN44]|nr:hypothetical protein [Phormidesmis sp. CAN_BIN44]
MLSLRHTLKTDITAMAAKHLLEIERAIHQLSAKEKLWLLERIARQLREPDEVELLDMASDPEIQTEITTINQEFALTEMDGLQRA